MIYVIPDSNVFLHFKSLDQIDINSVAGITDATLVITHILLNELDEHKYGPREGLRERAEHAIRNIN